MGVVDRVGVNKMGRVRHKHLRTRFVNTGSSRYKGMNPKAAKELHQKCGKNFLNVDRGLSRGDTKETIEHERYENYIMENGVRYKKADRLTRKYIDGRSKSGRR